MRASAHGGAAPVAATDLGGADETLLTIWPSPATGVESRWVEPAGRRWTGPGAAVDLACAYGRRGRHRTKPVDEVEPQRRLQQVAALLLFATLGTQMTGVAVRDSRNACESVTASRSWPPPVHWGRPSRPG